MARGEGVDRGPRDSIGRMGLDVKLGLRVVTVVVAVVAVAVALVAVASGLAGAGLAGEVVAEAEGVVLGILG